jgi:tetratricopeptide (TPR) repeat protein
MCVPSLCTALEPLPCTNIAPRGHNLLICASAAPAFPSESGIGTFRLPARERIMRILTLLIGAAALFAVAAPAAAASRADWDACNGDDPDQSIAACTRIIQGRGETAKDSAIAHQRGLAYKSKGDFDRAIADFSESIRLEPDGLLGLFAVCDTVEDAAAALPG